jgi:CheY-like chemotaxis protein
VPGAFMSMLGIAFLNDIVNKTAFNKHIRSLEANEILNQLREHVINSLHQSGRPDEPKDGMDMSLCIIDLENKQMQFAGAHNPAFIVREGKPIILEADKMSIGICRDTDTSFSNQHMELKINDAVYISSDGFYDQFGGPKGQKMLSGTFRKYLQEIYHKPMSEQKQLLEEFYENWKGKNEQLDDVMVVGFRFCPQTKMSSILSVLLWPDKHFLIAEDTELNYILLVEALKPTRVKITRVVNGKEAVEACKKTKFDLVLMDINMPEMDGLEASREIRKFDLKTPIIAHTAILRDEDLVDFKAAGCDDFISKPIDFKTFLSKISKNLFKNT